MPTTAASSPSGPDADRLVALDWMRTGAFALLIAYHAGMPYVKWGYHLMSPAPIDWLHLPMLLVNQWRLTLLFFISGAVALQVLPRWGVGRFVRERMLRIGLPLVVGMFGLVVPLQVYLERLYRGQFTGSFWAFWPTQFTTGAYPDGNLSWHHLWFLPYLLVYAVLVLVPLWWLLQRVRVADWLLRLPTQAWALALPGIVFVANELWLRPVSPSTHNLIADWANHVKYLFAFLMGAWVLGSAEGRAALMAQRRLWLGVTLALYALLIVEWLSEHDTWPRPLYVSLRAYNVWASVLALVGYGLRYLTARPAWLVEANTAVYPLYIVHQTVTLGLVFFLLPLVWSLELKWAATVLGTFVGSVAIYLLLIRPWPWIRPLFGLKNA